MVGPNDAGNHCFVQWCSGQTKATTTWECRLTEFLLRFKFQDGDGGGSGVFIVYLQFAHSPGWLGKKDEEAELECAGLFAAE